MTDLTLSDVDGLRDLADRCRRAAGTARQATPGPAGPHAKRLLADLGSRLEAAARSADALAHLIEQGDDRG